MNSSSLSRAEWVLGAICLVSLVTAGSHLAIERQPHDTVVMLVVVALSALAFHFVRHARRSVTEVSSVLSAAAAGDLEKRIILLGDGGELHRLAKDANRLLDVTDAFVREAKATLACIRDGRNHRRIVERGMVGTFGQASSVMNEAVSTIEARLAGFSRVMAEFEATVGGVTGSLGTAVESLSRSAVTMRANAVDTEHRSTAIGASAEETSVTVSTVAAATEELTASVEDIARQSELAREIAGQAATRVGESRAAIADLTGAVADIVGVVDLIRSVAEQTKLLALNATIEAARAGEAGRGFGVVATEVKALAGETASATESIAERIQAVDERARRCMAAIEGITGVVGDIAAASMAISSAVQQQISATHEIARSMQMASSATDEVSSNVGNVAQAAGETGKAADRVAGASGELAEQTERLQQSVRAFLERAREVAHGNRAA
jgi:methyl-accepting chemotaxis protein